MISPEQMYATGGMIREIPSPEMVQKKHREMKAMMAALRNMATVVDRSHRTPVGQETGGRNQRKMPARTRIGMPRTIDRIRHRP